MAVMLHSESESSATGDFEIDLDSLQRTVQKYEQKEALKSQGVPLPTIDRRPEAAEDYVCNFLSRLGLKRTLAVFQSEFSQLTMSGTIDKGAILDLMRSPEDAQFEIERMRAHIGALEEEVSFLQSKVKEVKTTFDKLKKERDFHAMRHKQLVDERKKLTNDIQRLREQMSKYEPMIETLETKYRDALKSKMITNMKKERLEKKLEELTGTTMVQASVSKPSTTKEATASKTTRKPSNNTLQSVTTKTKTIAMSQKKQEAKKISFPPDNALPSNPFLLQSKLIQPSFVTQPSSTLYGCKAAVGCLAKHPTKNCVLAGFDDGTWKIYSEEGMQPIISGGGHDAWIGGCAFTAGYIDTEMNTSPLKTTSMINASNYSGLTPSTNTNTKPGKSHVPNSSTSMLATCGGDSTIKIWSLASLSCLQVLKAHQSPVWSCDFHCTSRFLISGSQDTTVRMWDVDNGYCIGTLRGHVDSVNTCKFAPYSNLIATASGDKSVSLWDPRIPGQCAHTFFGHTNAVNSLSFSKTGDQVASCDADGRVFIWDVNERKEICSIDVGPHSANCIEFDRYGKCVFVGSDDGLVRMVNFANLNEPSIVEFSGHTDSVQALCLLSTGLLSGSIDETLRLWL